MGIKLLPEGVWTRIAAGEVVERPSSAVKEMVENSLDAGAQHVKVKLWDGGRVRIVVEDDGSGIAFDELPLALTPHATSKIDKIDDLGAIKTLGYRGEALASLMAVAKVEIRSRTADGQGGIIRAYEGSISDHVETNCMPGTRVQVDELFANLPARRKFMKSAAGELRRVAVIMREYAMCRPQVAFALEHDGRGVFASDGRGDRRHAIEQMWNSEPAVLNVSASAGHLSLECWWQPRQGRNDISSFVNGRAVNDPVIKGAVGAAARELTGAWALFFSIEPSLIDVNIHPAKAEIRFRYPSEVFEAVKLAAAQMGAPAPIYIRDGRPFSTDTQPAAPQKQTPSQAAGGWNFHDTEEPQAAWPLPRSASVKRAETASRPLRMEQSSDSLFNRIETPVFQEDDGIFNETEAAAMPEASTETADEDVCYMGQLAAGYLVFGTNGGLAIVDPHAAHERVAFERIRASAKDGKRSQGLLLPLPLPPTLALEVAEKQERLQEIGFETSEKDGVTQLTAIPYIAGYDTAPEGMLRSSLAALKESRDGDPTELLWRVWATMACKSAVKITTKLTEGEAMVLWKDLHDCAQPFFCPHGRPTILNLNNEQLAKHFGRE